MTSIAQELERVNARAGIEFDTEILRPRHAGDDPALDLVERQVLALAGAD
jgi:hypothetical protein